MSNTILEKISKLIKENINLKKKIFLHEPEIDSNDQNNLINCAKSSFVSTVGAYSNKFEKKLKKITESKYIIPTVNGTSALHAILFSLNISAVPFPW